MKFFPFKYLSICLLLLFSTAAVQLYANEIEIRYHLPEAKKITLVWGVNDWQYYGQAPVGTIRSGKVMHTPMLREGNDFIVRINIPKENVIDYAFIITKPAGPLRLDAEYWNLNNKSANKFYHLVTDSSQVIKMNDPIDYSSLRSNITLSGYSYSLFFFFTASALLVFFIKKYYFKTPARQFNQTGFFTVLSLLLTSGLFFIRIFIADIILPMLLKPVSILPYVFSTAWSDTLFAALLILFFGVLFLLLKKFRKLVLIFYTVIVFIVLITAIINIKVTELIGQPLNYQWLYYSDFLNSTDSSKAIGANVTADFITAGIFLLLAFVVLLWLLYQSYRRWPLAVAMIFPLLLAGSFLVQLKKPAKNTKSVNHIFYFIVSLNAAKAEAMLNSRLASESEFNKKNTDSLPTSYASQFKNSRVKNVIILVLESIPAEYISAYDSTLKATPFISSIKDQTVVFENIYAHTPATNKSMFSILCATYPNLTFTTVTKENPGIQLASITSELKKDHYRTLFLNSGDNQFQNAEEFLKYRGFDEVLDFRTNNCGAVFSDKRFSNDKLDGVDDSCLSARFFNWQQQDTSKPFFAMLWTFQTHYPYFHEGNLVQYDTENPSLNKYLNALHRADQTLQQLVEELKKKQLLESTLIVVTGDHGEAFGRHNQTTHASNIYEENIHIPLLIFNPSLFKGEKISVTGGISDIAPTIFSTLNRPSPAQWQGESLFSLNRRKTVYFFAPYSELLFGFREDNFKFIYNASDKSFKMYDLSLDKYETKNIAGEKTAYLKQANEKLQAWMKYQADYIDKLQKSTTIK